MESCQVRGSGTSWLGLQGPPWPSRNRRLQGAAGVSPTIPRPPGPLVSDFALQARAIGPRGSQEPPPGLTRDSPFRQPGLPRLPLQGPQLSLEDSGSVLNNRLVGLSLGRMRVTGLAEPLEITFSHQPQPPVSPPPRPNSY